MKQPNRVARRYNRTVLCCALASCLGRRSTRCAGPVRRRHPARPGQRRQWRDRNHRAQHRYRRGSPHPQPQPTAATRWSASRRAPTRVRGRRRARADGAPVGRAHRDAEPQRGRRRGPGHAQHPGGGGGHRLACRTSRRPKSARPSRCTRSRPIPQITRNFLEFADTVPGMMFTQRRRTATPSLRGGAQNASSINVYIDGVGQKSYVKEGGVSGPVRQRGNPFPQLAIGEYKVITSNYKAEYDQISSAAVTAVTKSGTNDFHGEAFYRYTDDDMRARTASEDQPGRRRSPSQREGVRLRRRRPDHRGPPAFLLHLRGASASTLPTTVVAEACGRRRSAAARGCGAIRARPAKPFQEDLYFGKLDWELTDRDRHRAQRRNIATKRRPTTSAAATRVEHRHRDRTTTTSASTLRWQHSADNWFNEVLAHARGLVQQPVADHRSATVSSTHAAADERSDHHPDRRRRPRAAQNKGQKGWSIEDNLTFNNFDWHGDHTVKMGVALQGHRSACGRCARHQPAVLSTTSIPTASPATIRTRPSSPSRSTGIGGLSPSVDTNAKQFGLYIQDDWAVNEHLTAQPRPALGLRGEPGLPGLRHAGQRGRRTQRARTRTRQPGQTYAQSLAQWRHRHQRLHQHRQQPRRATRTSGSRAWASRTTSMPTRSM